MAKKITVIGGAGFLGTSLCQLLSNRGADFEIIDLKISNRFSEKSKIADVRDVDSLRAAITGNVIVNLAAVHRDDVSQKSDYYNTNVLGAENIAKVCMEKGAHKIIFTSSVAVYGFSEHDIDESGKIQPFNEYGKTKFAAEEKLREWFSKGNHNLIIVRPTVIFGEGNRGNVFNLFKQIVEGKFIMVGSGKNKKSMAYVENVAEFLNACIISQQKYAIFNYVDKPDIDMNTLVETVCAVTNKEKATCLRLPYWFGLLIGYLTDFVAVALGIKFPISAIRVKKFCKATVFASSSSALDQFEAPYSLKQAIEKTLHNEFVEPDPNLEVFFTE